MKVKYRPSDIRMLQKETHCYMRDFCSELLLKSPWGRGWLLPIQLPTQYRSFFEIATRREIRTVVWTHVKWRDFNSVDSSRNLWLKTRVVWHSICVIFRCWFDSRHKDFIFDATFGPALESSLLFNGYQGTNRRNVKFTTHLHLTPRITMSGASPPLP